MDKHKFAPNPSGVGSSFCKFFICTKCGCIKEKWRKGNTYWIDKVFYNNEPKCIIK